MDRDKIDQAITKCRECRLCHERKNPVPGEGGTDVTIMLVGEAPGREEDMQGRPFVGRAGNLLDAMLQSGGLARKDVFITNAVKC
ncbi:MAG TPA: uracil-DNA glycosylase, partial [Euryarchaeota archaeon]|nr:uracil-DNA glycosylase [Euryarchaeota archaeon]